MKLYSHWRSSTSYRVRAALNLKGARHETVPVDLAAGAQASAEYALLNPGRGVPTLVLEDGTALTRSLAILEYLDAAHPAPALLPDDPVARAKVQAIAQTIALDVHPVNNLRVIGELKARFNATPEQLRDWMCHWMRAGFETAEELLPAGRDFALARPPDWRTSASSYRPTTPIAGASISWDFPGSQGARPPVWPFRPSPPPTPTNNQVHR
jgi:maleylacetoacetate isomerase/maleylpyruvate isomerase